MSGGHEKIRLLFFVPHLSKGGAEKHFARLINSLDSEYFDKLVVTSKPDLDYKSLIEDGAVSFYSLNVKSSSSLITVLGSIRPLKRMIDKLKPHIVISAMDIVNMATYLSIKMAKHKTKSVALVQASLEQSLRFENNITKSFLKRIMPYVYAKTDRVIVLSHGIKEEIVKRIKYNSSDHITVIPNIGLAHLVNSNKSEKMAFSVCCCGRLIKAKGFDLVINSFEEVVNKYPQAQLIILGDGPERRKLESLALNLKISENVIFKGYVDNPENFIKRSQIFVFASHYEAFGNVIVEAMGAGAAIVATDCPYGPGEIITHMKDGVLVDVGSEKEIAKAIINLFSQPSLINKLARNGQSRAQSYTPEVISNKYKSEILACLT